MKWNIKVAIFGCKSTTAFLVEELHHRIGIHAVITIPPQEGAKAQVADYMDLAPLCDRLGIIRYVARTYSLRDVQDILAIQNLGADIAFAIGWQRLLPSDVLNSFRLGVFGMHGSSDNLPRGRGRSPLNWAIIERRNLFWTNLFRYDAGVDSGDIVDSFVFSIRPEDTAETLHYKNVLAMKALILSNFDAIVNNNISYKVQPSDGVTLYPRRYPEDSIIDWNRDLFYIDAHVRAVTRPFNGAYSFLNGKKIVIYRVAIFETDLVDFGYRGLPLGGVADVFPSGKFLVRCRGGLLIVHEYESDVTPKKGDVLVSPTEMIRKFPLNEWGYHDMPCDLNSSSPVGNRGCKK